MTPGYIAPVLFCCDDDGFLSLRFSNALCCARWSWGLLPRGPVTYLCLVAQSCQTLCDPMDCSPPASSVHRDFPGKNTGVGFMPSSRGSSQPWDRTQSPTLQVDSLPTERPGKPKHTEVGSLSLLQRIFLTQELNRGLLHCKRILY